MHTNETPESAAAKLCDELKTLDAAARRDHKSIQFYEAHYARPVSFNLLGHSYRDVTRFRFRSWASSRNAIAFSIVVRPRANARQYNELPQAGEITKVTAVHVAPPPSLPPLDHTTIVATLTAMRDLSKAAGRKLPGYIVEFGQLKTFTMGRRTFSNIARLKFHDFRVMEGDLYVTLASNARTGYCLPTYQIVRVLPAKPSTREDRFASFEEFARRFDKRFIADTVLRDLWNSKHSQHGQKFRPSDFKPIGKKGRRVVDQFLNHFTSLDQATPGYNADGILTIKNYSQHERIGRDISLTHSVGLGRITYSSEYPGCGNGSYYFLATEKTILHIEDD